MLTPTDLDPVGTNVEDSHHAGDESPDGLEVQTADTPGAVHQQHNVGLSLSPAGHL